MQSGLYTVKDLAPGNRQLQSDAVRFDFHQLEYFDEVFFGFNPGFSVVFVRVVHVLKFAG